MAVPPLISSRRATVSSLRPEAIQPQNFLFLAAELWPFQFAVTGHCFGMSSGGVADAGGGSLDRLACLAGVASALADVAVRTTPDRFTDQRRLITGTASDYRRTGCDDAANVVRDCHAVAQAKVQENHPGRPARTVAAPRQILPWRRAEDRGRLAPARSYRVEQPFVVIDHRDRDGVATGHRFHLTSSQTRPLSSRSKSDSAVPPATAMSSAVAASVWRWSSPPGWRLAGRRSRWR